MRVCERLKSTRPCYSFEFFPPRDDVALDGLYQTIAELSILEPGFVSVTYGAGGQTRDRTLDVVTRIKRTFGLEAMAHLTCVGHTVEELAQILDDLAADGLENVLALRGDPPPGQSYAPTPGGFAYANDLVAFIKQRGYKFCVGGACYPEGHIEAASRQQDLDHLKRKVDAGAEFLICQLFFDNAFYFDFVERARAAGITVPIVPGIMPVTNLEQLERFTRMCGATVPMRLRLGLERCHDAVSIRTLGVAHATVQCMELLNRGVRAIHFFTLNKSPASRLIVSALKGVFWE
jgi:methylenetetrahydrofolate reductase (NADPH)